MCKLCNSTRPANTGRIFSPASILLSNIFHDYANEYPCKSCLHQYSSHSTANDNRKLMHPDEIDEYILYRLRRNYHKPTKRIDYRKSHAIATILIRTNTKSGNSTYQATVETSGNKIIIGSYSTFEEALVAKIDYLITHNITRSLNILQTKLKELL